MTLARALFALAAVLAATAPAMAQPVPATAPGAAPRQATAPAARPGSNLPNASNQPIAIEADRLEVRDREKVAVFAGNVIVTQGHTRMTASSMRVLYDGDVAPGAGGSSSSIRRIEAAGPIVVTQPDQTMTGTSATYEMATRTIVVSGGVVLTQGRNVVRGARLTLDMRSNHAIVERGANGERPSMLLTPDAASAPPATVPPTPAPRR